MNDKETLKRWIYENIDLSKRNLQAIENIIKKNGIDNLSTDMIQELSRKSTAIAEMMTPMASFLVKINKD